MNLYHWHSNEINVFEDLFLLQWQKSFYLNAYPEE